jgi:hypothetical protein
MNVAHDGIPNGCTSPPVAQENAKFTPLTTIHPMGTEPMMVFTTLLCVEINRSANDNTSYPIKPFLKELLCELQQVDPQNTIIPILH